MPGRPLNLAKGVRRAPAEAPHLRIDAVAARPGYTCPARGSAPVERRSVGPVEIPKRAGDRAADAHPGADSCDLVTPRAHASLPRASRATAGESERRCPGMSGNVRTCPLIWISLADRVVVVPSYLLIGRSFLLLLPQPV